jgi:hypothetical protein
MDGPIISDADGRRPLGPEPSPLSARDLARLAWLARRLPSAWVASRRRRRLLFLALAAPGFFAVFDTILHHNFFLMLAGFVLFAAAVIFRLRTEPLIERAVVAGLWPLPHSVIPPAKDTHHA